MRKSDKRQRTGEKAAGSNGSKAQVKKTHILIPFEKTDRILFVGEGNFSFAASCVEHHLEHAEDIVATSYDSERVVLEKYTDAVEHISAIRDCCGTVLHDIDATKLDRHFGLGKQLFDVVLFLFPHVAAGIADEDRNILTNQRMLTAFFKSVGRILAPGGTVAVTLAVSKTYELWDLRGLAKSQGFRVKTSGSFVGSAFPGYEHRRTQGHNDNDSGFSGGKGEERSARWTIFELGGTLRPTPKKAKSDEDDED